MACKKMKYRAYIFIGPPASGKGTHCKAIGTLPGFFHFSMGAAFRGLDLRQVRDAQLVTEIQRSITTGELVSDRNVLAIFRNAIDRLAESGAFSPEHDCVLLDGIPRTRGQAEGLAETVEVLKVFQIVCDREVILARTRGRALKEGRADDTVEVLENRIAIYERELGPLMDLYPPEVVATIDTTDPPAQVLRNMLGSIR